MLRGPTKDFHDLREAVAKLDDWAALAEVERFRRYEDTLRSVQNEIEVLCDERKLLEDRIDACRNRIEATRLPSKVSRLRVRFGMLDEEHRWHKGNPDKRKPKVTPPPFPRPDGLGRPF